MMEQGNRTVRLEELEQLVRAYQEKGLRVAHCHGCFDILHFGHLRHFAAARALADVLVVTVTPDRFVNKGPGRPVFEEQNRAEMVAALRPVEHVAINEWSSAVDTIRLLRPDYFIKGQEYESPEQQVNPNFTAERDAAVSVGTEIRFTYEDVSSSTHALRRLSMAVDAQTN